MVYKIVHLLITVRVGGGNVLCMGACSIRFDECSMNKTIYECGPIKEVWLKNTPYAFDGM